MATYRRKPTLWKWASSNDFPSTPAAVLDKEEIRCFGEQLHRLAAELWPLNRSLTGEGNRKTLAIIKREIPDLKIVEVPSGTPASDWIVPDEWEIRSAWIKTPAGEKICDFALNNLHVVGYSEPIHRQMSLEDLQSHLHSLPDQPDAIPYVTSYYSRRWGFCLTENERASLEDGIYEVYIDSRLFSGSLSYGELVIPGESKSEILLSTYICHPSMANNELSGIVVAVGLAQWLSGLPSRRHTYRILFVPETIGPVVYLSKHRRLLQKRVVAGYVLTCVGDNRAFSYVPTRLGKTLTDRVALHVLHHLDPEFVRYTWGHRQSDERQYNSPNVSLPVGSIMRSKYATYPEYHTSLDDLNHVVTPAGLAGSLLAYMSALQIFELDFCPSINTIGEPQLGKRGLYPTLSKKGVYAETRFLRDVISWCDGEHSLLEIAEKLSSSFSEVLETVTTLRQAGLLT